MINHLVLMNLHKGISSEFVQQQVLSLADGIPGLESVRGGKSVVQLSTTWDLGFVMTFTNPESVKSYQSHPVHLEVASQIKGLIQDMATCDIAALEQDS